MTVTPTQIDRWRAEPSEHQRLEFKEAKRQFGFDELCRYCVALANEGGGTLLFGVADKPPRAVVGSAACADPVGMAAKLHDAVRFRVDIQAVDHPDGRVVVFVVPSRPRGTAYHHQGAYLMRSGASLVAMTEDRLRQIFAETQPDWLEEPAETGLSSQDVLARLDVPTFFQLLDRPAPTTPSGLLDQLVAERLVDRAAHGFAIRRLGALLLARDLTTFPELSRRAPRVIVYRGTSKLQTTWERTFVRGLAVGFQEFVQAITDQLPQNEVIESALRRQVKLVPDLVVRELAANALIHQDLRLTGVSTMVEIYSDRLEISNPGTPIVPTDRFIDGYQSRNERLADLMRRLRICEEKGSGVDKVIHATEVYQLPAPDFRVGHDRTTAVVFGPRSFDDMDRDDRVRACYQHCCLRWVMNERMTNQSLRERFQLPDAKAAVVSQVIAAAVEAERITLDKAVGTSRRLARYLPFWA